MSCNGCNGLGFETASQTAPLAYVAAGARQKYSERYTSDPGHAPDPTIAVTGRRSSNEQLPGLQTFQHGYGAEPQPAHIAAAGGMALAGQIGGIILGVWGTRKWLSKKGWASVVGGLVGWQIGGMVGGMAGLTYLSSQQQG